MDINSEKVKILIVDDDAGMRRIVKFHLTKAGYHVDTAENGEKGLEHLKKEIPDLIVSDVSMPVMNGYELYKEVSSKKEYKFIPFLFLTSKADRDDIILAKKMGVDDYLTKPVDKDLLLISVEAKLARFKELKDQNKKAIDQKINDIYRTLSHEINTPISIIQGFTDLSDMLLSSGRIRIDDFKDFLGGIKSGNERLKKLSERVLVLNSIDGGYEEESYRALKEKDFVDMGNVIKIVYRNIQPVIKDKNIEYNFNLQGEPLCVRAVESHMICIMDNIIDNAVKFVKPETGKVSVKAYRKDNIIYLEVEDNGIGIPEDEIKNIFTRYYQYNRRNFEQQGLGIGLTLVESLARINKVDLKVKSEPEGGTVFTLIFKELFDISQF